MRTVVFLGIFLGLIAPLVDAEDSALWSTLLADKHVALMRHAIAPGTGDPAEFSLGDCSTQRNLSTDGRDQARRIGERFRANGIATARVFSSEWCRCLETTRLLGLGPVEKLALLNSFFQTPERGAKQTADLIAWLASHTAETPKVLVTHQVNITALTGIYPKSGEILIIRWSKDGDTAVVGSVETN